MKIRSKEELSDALSSQLVWRKKELSDLKYLLEFGGIASTRKNVLIRSAVAMIYAHWEGYIKVASNYYLEYIASKRLLNNELKDNFLAISMITSSKTNFESKKYSSYQGIVEFFKSQQGSRAKIPYKSIIDTESNLSSVVLRELIWCLNLDYSPFETKEHIINSKLLQKRNHIAHGEEIEISIPDLYEMRDTIIPLLDNFKTQIENCAISENYKI